jgi:hypothetical protein
MKRQTELKSVRYGISFRPSTKSTVLFALATFLLVIHVVKSSSEEEFRNLDSNSNGEFELLPLRFSNYFVDFTESESCATISCAAIILMERTKH